MKFKVEVFGVKELQVKINTMGKSVKNLSSPLKQAESLLNESYQKNYPSKGATLNQPWPPRKRSYPWPILVKSGRMKGAYTSKITSKDLTIQNQSPYAKYHQFGTTKLPVRSIIGITPKLLNEIKKIIQKYIFKK